jgi:hypothetical protein
VVVGMAVADWAAVLAVAEMAAEVAATLRTRRPP